MPEGQQPEIRSCRRSVRNRSGGTLYVNQMSLFPVWAYPPDSAAPIVRTMLNLCKVQGHLLHR